MLELEFMLLLNTYEIYRQADTKYPGFFKQEEMTYYANFARRTYALYDILYVVHCLQNEFLAFV